MGKAVEAFVAKVAATPGWRVAKTTDGWMLYPPDKNQSGVLIHKTPSDWRWKRQARAYLRQRGWEEK